MDLRDKVIVITGASSGFGEQIARRCAQAGANVVLAARSAERLERLAAELGADRALAAPTDVTSDAGVTRLVATTLERFGRADVLVANAGFGVLDPITDARIEDLQEMIDVNLYGTVRCIKAFLPDMLRRRNGSVYAAGVVYRRAGCRRDRARDPTPHAWRGDCALVWEDPGHSRHADPWPEPVCHPVGGIRCGTDTGIR